MVGRTVLVTGGTAGIGRAAALELARRGAAVVIVGRNRRRGKAAIAQMEQETGEARHHFLPADLATLAGVRRLAAEVRDRFDDLDVLFNNAGGFFLRRRLTEDGYERTFALNHLAPFLLTHLLLDTLGRSKSPRIVTTSSGAHRSGEIELEDLHLESRYRPWLAYAQSKLANVLFTRELARRLEGDGIPCNCFHPGLVATNLASDMPLVRPFAKLFLRIFGKSPAAGARSGVYLASAPEADRFNGEYFYQGRPVRPKLPPGEEETSRRLWAISEELTALEPELQLAP